jgi:hypothetical protein
VRLGHRSDRSILIRDRVDPLLLEQPHRIVRERPTVLVPRMSVDPTRRSRRRRQDLRGSRFDSRSRGRCVEWAVRVREIASSRGRKNFFGSRRAIRATNARAHLPSDEHRDRDRQCEPPSAPHPRLLCKDADVRLAAISDCSSLGRSV